MPLDPQARFVLDQLAAQGGLELHELTPDAARRAFAALRLPIPAEPSPDTNITEEFTARFPSPAPPQGRS